MRIFTAIGIVIFGCLAVAGFIKPFIDSMMPTIIEVGTDAEIAMWGLMPILILVMLIPCAILIIRRNKRQ